MIPMTGPFTLGPQVSSAAWSPVMFERPHLIQHRCCEHVLELNYYPGFRIPQPPSHIYFQEQITFQVV